MSKDYYKILDLDKGASQDEVKKAFRKKAHKFHPDKEGGDEEKFKEANEAYQVLSDPQKRQKYDQFGSAAFEGGGFGGGHGFGGFSGQGFEDLGDIFGDLFGGRRRGPSTPRGNDVQIDLDLSFKESVFGVDHDIDLTKTSTCERCAGTGGEPGTSMDSCDTCDGSGVQVTAQRTILGVMQHKQTCSDCVGTGEIPSKKCKTCHGHGVDKASKKLSVRVPAGVENGAVLRVRGEGEAVRGGKPGDLFVRLHVKPDKRFDRQGSTIISYASIGFTQAALGDTIETPTVDGVVDLKIPAGTQSGAQFKLRGKGVDGPRGRGDQIVVVDVITPKKLSRQQKKLLEELDLKE